MEDFETARSTEVPPYLEKVQQLFTEEIYLLPGRCCPPGRSGTSFSWTASWMRLSMSRSRRSSRNRNTRERGTVVGRLSSLRRGRRTCYAHTLIPTSSTVAGTLRRGDRSSWNSLSVRDEIETTEDSESRVIRTPLEYVPH